jgi:hypothetical protein
MKIRIERLMSETAIQDRRGKESYIGFRPIKRQLKPLQII